VRWTDANGSQERRTNEPGRVVADLMKSGEPKNLEIVRPSLEDVYLKLVEAYEVSTGSTQDQTSTREQTKEPVR